MSEDFYQNNTSDHTKPDYETPQSEYARQENSQPQQQSYTQSQ